MNSMDVEVLRTAVAWLARGHRVVMGTVVRTWGSAPRPPGSLMVIRDDGQVAGSLSGGCIEDDLIARVARGELALDRPRTTSYGVSADEAQRFGLPCGGTVEIVLEPLGPQSAMAELLQSIERHQVVARRLDMASGAVTLLQAREGDQVTFDGSVLQTVHGPRLRLLVVGAGQLSRYVAAMALMLDYRVTVCDPREEYHEAWQGAWGEAPSPAAAAGVGCAVPADVAGVDAAGITLSREMPDDLVQAMKLDAMSAVVALTHDPKIDDLALMEALKTPAFYVGALGSRRNNARRRERLREFEVTEEQAAALRGPVGLNLGGRTPPEIALAIMAEITAVRRGRPLAGPLAAWDPAAAATGSGCMGTATG
jgi:xanthine dehydrogenase accessory factor